MVDHAGCKAPLCERLGGCAGHAPRLTLQEWTRVRKFVFDLTDPEGYAFAVNDEVRRRAFELQALFP